MFKLKRQTYRGYESAALYDFRGFYDSTGRQAALNAARAICQENLLKPSHFEFCRDGPTTAKCSSQSNDTCEENVSQVTAERPSEFVGSLTGSNGFLIDRENSRVVKKQEIKCHNEVLTKGCHRAPEMEMFKDEMLHDKSPVRDPDVGMNDRLLNQGSNYDVDQARRAPELVARTNEVNVRTTDDRTKIGAVEPKVRLCARWHPPKGGTNDVTKSRPAELMAHTPEEVRATELVSPKRGAIEKPVRVRLCARWYPKRESNEAVIKRSQESISDNEEDKTELAGFSTDGAKMPPKVSRIYHENMLSMPKRRRGSEVDYSQSMEKKTDADRIGCILTNRRDNRVCKTRINPKEKEISRIFTLVLILCLLSLKNQAQQLEFAKKAGPFVASLTNTPITCHAKEGLMAPSFVDFPFDNG